MCARTRTRARARVCGCVCGCVCVCGGGYTTEPHAPASEMASMVIGTLPKVCGLLSSRPMAAVRSYLYRFVTSWSVCRLVGRWVGR